MKAVGATGKVYRVVGDNSVEELQVRLGAKMAGTITILFGIAPGDRLAAGNLGQLRDGARIRPLP